MSERWACGSFENLQSIKQGVWSVGSQLLHFEIHPNSCVDAVPCTLLLTSDAVLGILRQAHFWEVQDFSGR